MSKVVVAKFGGSSLCDPQSYKTVKNIVARDPRRKYVVPSAPGKRDKDDHKVTDLLLMCHQLEEHNIDPDEVFSLVVERYEQIHRELGLKQDLAAELGEVEMRIAGGASAQYVASRGEYLNGKLLAEYLGYQFVDAAQIIRFDCNGKYDANETNRLLQKRLENESNVVIPGFYGADADSKIHTFSRGGSDVTGAIVAGVVGAELYENWTDVPGFLTADPKIVENAKPIEVLTYKELRELSYMGASVLHEEAIFPVREKGIPIHIRNTLVPDDRGTLIVDDRAKTDFTGITGLAGMKDFTAITLEKTLMDNEKGFLRKLVSVLETNGVSIAHVPSGIDSVSVVVRSEDVRFNLDKIVAELKIYCNPDSIRAEPGISLVAIVGKGMVRTPGIASRIFSSLANADVNVTMITQGASELSVIVGVDNTQFEDAVRALHDVI